MAEEKTIRGSQRGLTFSFSEQGSLTVGQRYDYIIDKAAKPGASSKTDICAVGSDGQLTFG